MNPAKKFLDWLRNVPVDDPVDRRNAPAMQVLFFLLGTTMPVLWIHHMLYAAMPRGGMVSFVTSMVVAAAYLASVAMIRRGRFRESVWLYLAATLVGMEIEYLHAGFLIMGTQHTEPMLALIIGGLVMGRRTLWVIFVLLMVIAASGYAVDTYRLDDLSVSSANLMTSVVNQFTVALILDRTANALRESLAESEQRRLDLEREMQARERVQSQLIHAQKLEATGRLASGIAHDFGNLLGVIQGYAGQRDRILTMERRGDQETAIDMALSGIEDAAERGTAITRKLLSFTRHDMAQRSRFDAAPVLAGLQPMLRQLFPSSVRLHLPDATPALWIHFDRSEFELMILNIAANARDAMPSGGEFRIASSVTPEGRIRLELMDNGHGMDPGVQQRIFEPFFSTKLDVGGTGLGLAVIRDMIIAAGGDIAVRSAPGQGSTFVVTLPSAADDDAGEPARAQPPASGTSRRT